MIRVVALEWRPMKAVEVVIDKIDEPTPAITIAPSCTNQNQNQNQNISVNDFDDTESHSDVTWNTVESEASDIDDGA